VEPERLEFRARSGLWLAIAVWAICLLNLVTLGVVHDWAAVPRAIPVVALASVAAWMLFGRPTLFVETDDVLLVNPGRDVRIPWAAIREVQPGFMLAVTTDRGKFRAWSAPGASQMAGTPSNKSNQLMMQSWLPEDDKFGAAGETPPDPGPRSLAVAAAAEIRRRWQLAQDSGAAAVTRPGEEPGQVTVRWHTAWLIALAVLAVASIIALV
jgi:hypothetical protein